MHLKILFIYKNLTLCQTLIVSLIFKTIKFLNSLHFKILQFFKMSLEDLILTWIPPSKP